MSELLANFHFLRPQWLFLLLPCAILALLLWRSRGTEPGWSRVVSPELLPFLISSDSVNRSRRSVPALLAAWCLAVLAAAGPSWKQLPQPVLQKQDALVLVMDLSYSMLATDLQPSRQDRVRRKLMDLLRERREGLTALIAYAGDAHIVAPLTDDNPTIANLLPALTPEMMPLPGSNPVEAVERALALLDSAGARRGRILIVTDGVTASDARIIGDLMDGQASELAVLGVGTEVGAPIALPDGGFLKNESGEIVVPALDEGPLRSLVESGAGRYRRLSVDDSDLRALLSAGPLVNEEDTITLDRRADRWQDMAHWLLIPLLGIVLMSFRRGRVYLLPLLFGCFPAERSMALEWQDLWLRADQQGRRALAEGDTQRAASLFKDPAWQGTAAFAGEAYEEAARAFRRAENADGWYNRGNALAAQNRLDEAIDAYRRSLDLKPGQQDALRNIETLESLREQQEQQTDEEAQDSDGSEQQSQDSTSQQDQQNGDSSENSEQQSGEQQADGQQDGTQDPSQQQSPGQDSGQQSQADDENSGSTGDEEQSEAARARQPMPPPQIDNSAMQENMEKDQAMRQWLRRVPDDPSGLLREKFRYESRQRQLKGRSRENKQIW